LAQVSRGRRLTVNQDERDTVIMTVAFIILVALMLLGGCVAPV